MGNNKDNSVFCKVVGNFVGINETITAMDVCERKQGTSQENINQTVVKERMDISEKQRSSPKVLKYENDFIKDLSTP